MSMFLPIAIIVIAQTIYNLCNHATPSELNPFAAIFCTYIIAGTLSLILLLATTRGQNVMEQFRHLNWARVGLGFGIVMLDFGFIIAFRTGWGVSTCALVSNLILAVVLFAIGVIFYHEAFSVKTLLGLAVCMFGLYLINS